MRINIGFQKTTGSANSAARSMGIGIGVVLLTTAMPWNNATASGLSEVTLRKPTKQVAKEAGIDRKTVTRSVNKTRQAISDTDLSESPILVTVSLNQQQLSVYKGLDRVHRTQISSGKKGHTTPTGIYSILEKRKYHESNLYSNAPMPFMQRLTWSGIALHQGRVPPFPASHGCVRIPKGTAKTIYGKTRYGTHVIIARGSVSPRPVSHHSLFQPVKKNDLVASLRPVISDLAPLVRKNADKDAPLRIYATRTSRRDKTLKIQQMLNFAGFTVGKPDGIYGRNTVQAVKTFQRLHGLNITGTANDETLAKLRSLTRSRKLPDGKLYIRQKQKPVFEASYTIKDSHEPLGTHLVLLGGLSETKANWISVAIPSQLKKNHHSGSWHGQALCKPKGYDKHPLRSGPAGNSQRCAGIYFSPSDTRNQFCNLRQWSRCEF